MSALPCQQLRRLQLAQLRCLPQAQLVEIADGMAAETGAPDGPTLEEFLASLRTAWRQDEVRPTARKRETGKRDRRRPEPFAAVAAQLREWFEAQLSHRASK